MVSTRFTGFLLIFILLPLRFSSGRAQQQVKKRMVVTNGSKLETLRSSVNVEEVYYGVPAAADTDQRTRFLPGRGLMVSRGAPSKSKVVESEDGITAKGSATNKKARCEIGNCGHEEGEGFLNVKHKFRIRSRHSYANVKMSGLVPLNADYYVPRPHPPKNN